MATGLRSPQQMTLRPSHRDRVDVAERAVHIFPTLDLQREPSVGKEEFQQQPSIIWRGLSAPNAKLPQSFPDHFPATFRTLKPLTQRNLFRNRLFQMPVWRAEQ
jgi:hypothetical protein